MSGESARFWLGAALAVLGAGYLLISGMGYFIAAWGALGLLMLAVIPLWLPLAPVVPWLLTGALPPLFAAAWLALWGGAVISGSITPRDILRW